MTPEAPRAQPLSQETGPSDPHEYAPDVVEGYRPNVGVVLFNRAGLVWLGRRAGAPGPDNWQFPQGGVDPGEDLLDAARRELLEETGVRSAAFLERAPGWVAYDFPPGLARAKARRGFKGQRQAWFAFRFEGADGEIDLGGHHEVEFDRWRWAPLADAMAAIVDFKREAYRQVVAAFTPLAERLATEARGGAPGP